MLRRWVAPSRHLLRRPPAAPSQSSCWRVAVASGAYLPSYGLVGAPQLSSAAIHRRWSHQSSAAAVGRGEEPLDNPQDHQHQAAGQEGGEGAPSGLSLNGHGLHMGGEVNDGARAAAATAAAAATGGGGSSAGGRGRRRRRPRSEAAIQASDLVHAAPPSLSSSSEPLVAASPRLERAGVSGVLLARLNRVLTDLLQRPPPPATATANSSSSSDEAAWQSAVRALGESLSRKPKTTLRGLAALPHQPNGGGGGEVEAAGQQQQQQRPLFGPCHAPHPLPPVG